MTDKRRNTAQELKKTEGSTDRGYGGRKKSQEEKSTRG